MNDNLLLNEEHIGHRDRLRLRVQQGDMAGLKPHELLEFLLCYAIPRQDVNRPAHRLLDRFGSVQQVLKAPTAELMRVEGVGKRAAEWLNTVGKAVAAGAALRYSDCRSIGNYLDAFLQAMRIRRDIQVPSSWQLCLDYSGRMLYQREICPSRAWGEPETMRQALRDVLSSRARAVILFEFTEGDTEDIDGYSAQHANNYACTLNAAGCDLTDVLIIGHDVRSLRRTGELQSEPAGDVVRAMHERYFACDNALLAIADTDQLMAEMERLHSYIDEGEAH